jgi:hypothetical protein
MLCIVLKRKLAQRYTYAILCSALKRKLAQRYTYAMLCTVLKTDMFFKLIENYRILLGLMSCIDIYNKKFSLKYCFFREILDPHIYLKNHICCKNKEVGNFGTLTFSLLHEQNFIPIMHSYCPCSSTFARISPGTLR